MIFVAVGTQFPFDRLIRSMDAWAAEHDEPVIAQIANGDYEPQHIDWSRFMDSETYNQHIRDARVFVSHAGMGNIISAREHQTPIIIMNRQHQLGEHRNDHQSEGIVWMSELDGVYAAKTERELLNWLNSPKLSAAGTPDFNQHDQLVEYIADFIESDK